jgi:hypothetical protein
MNLKNVFFVSLLAICFAMSANAGVIDDTDMDLIPDVFDNCTGVVGTDYPNGPGESPNNQIDSDGDGFGNRCDADFNNTGATIDLADLNLFLAAFSGPGNNEFDLNYDGASINLGDLNIFLALFSGPPGG